MSTAENVPIDYDYLDEELRRSFPASVQQLLREYSGFSSSKGLLAVLPSELAAYFSLEHPRQRTGEPRGIRATDNVRVVSRNLPPAELSRNIAEVRPTQLLADFRLDEDAGGVASEFNYANEEALRSEQILRCIEALPKEATAGVLVDDWVIAGNEGGSVRKELVRSLHVSELFDCGGFWYMDWIPRDGDSSITQVARVPAADEWPEFIADLEMWELWRWGFLSELPSSDSWSWNSLQPDAPSTILRLLEQVDKADTATSLEAAAYLRIACIELCLCYLVQLRVGDGDALWPYVPEEVRKGVGQAWEGRGSLLFALNLIHFQKIVRAKELWPRFAELFAEPPGANPSSKQALTSLDSVNKVRNRIMHPVRFLAQPISVADVDVTANCLSEVKALVAKAEELKRSDIE